MSVRIDFRSTLKRGGADDLFAAYGSELKRLSPFDVGEIVPVIYLGLVDDKSTARLDNLAGPTGILGPYERRRREY
jgi:hypothetical protein